MMLKVLSVLIFLFGSSLGHATGIPTNSDDQEPTLLLVPLNKFVDLMSLGVEGGNAQQELLSEDGERHTDNSTVTYSVSLARKFTDNLIAGVRLGPAGVPLLLLSINLNIQYDVLKNDLCKLSALGMYGGIIYPGQRYGAGVLGSCFFRTWGTVGAVFLSYQSLVDKKRFEITSYQSTPYDYINYVEADIKYEIVQLGVEYVLPFKGVNNLSVLMSVGLQTLTDTEITHEEYVPSGYSIGNGSWSALEFRVYFP